MMLQGWIDLRTVRIGKDLRQMLLELGTVHLRRDRDVLAHLAPPCVTSNVPAVSRDSAGAGGSISGLRSSSRSLSLALCNCDFELPVEHSSIVAISLCSNP